MSACDVGSICGMRSRRIGANPYGWDCITYAAIAAKARSSSVGCSGKYSSWTMPVLHKRRTSLTRRILSGSEIVVFAHLKRCEVRSASIGISCSPPSCLMTRDGKISVLPK
ncbi:hypothetical protein CDL15_Pgr019516 [Punica granatum]|uniref:Uncharacterized protein n=1 Tax=Punica granatum TaxID=22663 RepID=A0A218Y115_PUNGR|nr:hypothetical protein CDL15_Pgr019516 [Punica granatum]